jgi:hypothetical protein
MRCIIIEPTARLALPPLRSIIDPGAGARAKDLTKGCPLFQPLASGSISGPPHLSVRDQQAAGPKPDPDEFGGFGMSYFYSIFFGVMGFIDVLRRSVCGYS